LIDNSNSNGGSSGGVSGMNVYKRSTELVLVSLSGSYSLLESILVSVSGPSSCPTLHFALTTLTTNYCPKEIVNNFGLRRLFYSKQDFKNVCYSSI